MMICRPADVLPIEAVVRGYLAGLRLEGIPANAARSAGSRCRPACARATACRSRSSRRRPRPSRASTTRTSASTDGRAHRPTLVGAGRSPSALAEAIRDRAIRLYRYGAAVAERRGILLADTKFEFGLAGDDETSASRSGRGSTPGSDGAARRPDPHRRGPDAGLVAVLGRRDVRAGPAAGELRQAVRPRLARDPAVGQDRARPGAAARTSSRARAPATSRRSSGSPAPASSATSRRTSIAR